MTEKEFARDIGSRIPPSHPDTEWTFRTDCIRNKFLIYDGKKNRCVCTNCGYEFDIAPGEYSHAHGLKDTCPCCEATCTCLSAGRGRRCYEEQHRVMTFASDGKSLWIVSNDILVSFADFAAAQLYRHVNEVFMVNAEEQRHWRYRDGWWAYPPAWDELKNFNPAPLPAAPYCVSKYDMHIFAGGIKEIVANSDCRYLMSEAFMNQMQWPSIASWICLQMKYPALELLRKGGFGMLAKNRLSPGCSNYMNAINIRAKTIEKALRLPKKWVKALRREGVSESIHSYELKAFQRATEKERAFIVKNWEAWSSLISSYRAEEFVRIIGTYTSIEKYLNYMTNQPVRKDPTYFADYLRNAAALGWDLGRNSILFPEDLKAAHDEAADLLEAEKNSEIDKRIAARAVDVEYRTESLDIICAKSQGDLNRESKELHHCVRTYGGRVADGKALIYFIRKTSEMATPYYTLEVDPLTGVVIQCRGERNCGMIPEVLAFTEGFEKIFKKMIKEGMKCQTA